MIARPSTKSVQMNAVNAWENRRFQASPARFMKLSQNCLLWSRTRMKLRKTNWLLMRLCYRLTALNSINQMHFQDPAQVYRISRKRFTKRGSWTQGDNLLPSQMPTTRRMYHLQEAACRGVSKSANLLSTTPEKWWLSSNWFPSLLARNVLLVK